MCGCQSESAYYLSPDTEVYRAYDLTGENLFSINIEGPSFRNDTLFVVNYQQDGTVGMVLKDGRVEKYIDLPEGSTANSIKFDPEGNMYLADFTEHNVLKITPEKQISPYYHSNDFNQPNDIVRSDKGWIYASDPNWAAGSGRIWLVKGQDEGQIVADSLGTTNGIALSPDEKYLYINESVQLKVWRYRIGDDGSLYDKTLFTRFDDFGMDGMQFGPDHLLYITRHGKGTVAAFDTTGVLVREIQLKGKNCSNLVFGDPDKKTAFVTLQDRRGMEMFRIE